MKILHLLVTALAILSFSCSGEDTDSVLQGSAPPASRVIYQSIGAKPGGYQTVTRAVWPNICEKGGFQPSSGALFPFKEAQTLVVRGPIQITNLVVYEKRGSQWVDIGRLPNLQWKEEIYGTTFDRGLYPKVNQVLENGRELFTHLPGSGEKLIVFRAQMPHATQAPIRAGAQNNVPAVWLLNSNIFKKPSAQYFCNCRGMGNPGGCGELDIAEVIPQNHGEITTTIYSYEGAVGAKLSPRPVNRYQVYAAVLRIKDGSGEISVVESQSFNFVAKSHTDAFISGDWLAPARHINPGNGRLR